jgi:hypothetical protein
MIEASQKQPGRNKSGKCRIQMICSRTPEWFCRLKHQRSNDVGLRRSGRHLRSNGRKGGRGEDDEEEEVGGREGRRGWIGFRIGERVRRRNDRAEGREPAHRDSALAPIVVLIRLWITTPPEQPFCSLFDMYPFYLTCTRFDYL